LITTEHGEPADRLVLKVGTDKFASVYLVRIRQLGLVAHDHREPRTGVGGLAGHVKGHSAAILSHLISGCGRWAIYTLTEMPS
jgi:hypothetical protein